jgi:GNAT superfamily N-acetyltransferase
VTARPAPGGVEIRPFHPDDRNEILAVTFETGFFGASMANVLDSRRLFTRATEIYLDRYPQHCHVAADTAGFAGYAVAGLREGMASSAGSSLGQLLFAALYWQGLTARDRRWMVRRIATPFRAFETGEWRFRTPSGAGLHLNLLPRMRGAGIGSRLLDAIFENLRQVGVRSVHANAYRADRNDTSSFWRAHGFEEYSCVRTSLWKPWLEEERVELVCWSREL